MSQLNSSIENLLLTIEYYKGSMSDFRAAVVLGKYHSCAFFSRTLAWKTCFLTDSLNTRVWPERLRTSRRVFRDLCRRQDMKVPWWSLDPDCDLYAPRPASASSPGPHHSSRTSVSAELGPLRLPRTPASADPLSQPGLDLSESSDTSDSPGPQKSPDLFKDSGSSRISGLPESSGSSECPAVSRSPPQDDSDTDVLHSVFVDVQRLFPGDPRFHDGSPAAVRRKRNVTTMLYIWAKCNPQVGYKQGMHEILGLLYVYMADGAVEMPLADDDSFSAADRGVLALFDAHFLQHDVFALFNRFVGASGVAAQFYQSESSLMVLINAVDALLMKVDQLVHYNLVTKLRLEPQLWIIRYLRLLLSRELDMRLLAVLWDKFMAAELLLPAGLMCLPHLVQFVVVVLLVRIKPDLMTCDFSEALTLLLHYPVAAKTAADPHFLDSLFHDAYLLYQNRSNDLKLYEHGLRLARKAGTGVSVLYLRPTTPVVSPRSSVESSLPTAEATRAANMAFEKTRLEMRLKKKAQLMVRP